MSIEFFFILLIGNLKFKKLQNALKTSIIFSGLLNLNVFKMPGNNTLIVLYLKH